MRGPIIVLNGASSSGKTTLALALQAQLDEPFYVVQLDAFEGMIPPRLQNGGAEELEALTWSALAMHRTVAFLSDGGVSVIADYVFLDAPGFDTWLGACVAELHRHPVWFVGVHCPLAELERRERVRGDRDIGQARWQFPRVHTHGDYDLELDSSADGPDRCVDLVRDRLRRPGAAFARLHQAFQRGRNYTG